MEKGVRHHFEVEPGTDRGEEPEQGGGTAPPGEADEVAGDVDARRLEPTPERDDRRRQNGF